MYRIYIKEIEIWCLCTGTLIIKRMYSYVERTGLVHFQANPNVFGVQ